MTWADLPPERIGPPREWRQSHALTLGEIAAMKRISGLPLEELVVRIGERDDDPRVLAALAYLVLTRGENE